MQGTHFAHAIVYAYRDRVDGGGDGDGDGDGGNGGNGHLKAKVGESMKLLVTLLGFIRLVGSGLSVFHLVIVG